MLAIRHLQGMMHQCIFTTLIFLAAWSHLKAMTSDPGLVIEDSQFGRLCPPKRVLALILFFFSLGHVPCWCCCRAPAVAARAALLRTWGSGRGCSTRRATACCACKNGCPKTAVQKRLCKTAVSKRLCQTAVAAASRPRPTLRPPRRRCDGDGADQRSGRTQKARRCVSCPPVPSRRPARS